MIQRQTALITGAGSGIGRATAVLLAECGYDLALMARTESALRKTAELAGERAAEADRDIRTLVTPGDVTRPEDCRRVVDEAAEHLGGIDALANVAGAAPRLPIEEVTEDVWRRCIDTNLSAIIYLITASWPVFARQRRGIVVNVSSLASIDPFPGFGIYASAKAGVNMFTKCMAREGEPIGLQAVAVAPGAVETPMLREIFDESIIPKHMALAPTDVAAVIRDCIIGKRRFEPGETIVLPSPA